MGATHFRLRTLEKVRTEMSLHVLAYNLKRMIALMVPNGCSAVWRRMRMVLGARSNRSCIGERRAATAA